MKIEVKIVKRFPDTEKVKAIANIVFADSFALHGVKVISGENDVFVAMPNRKVGDEYKDIFHPINRDARKELCDAVIAAYKKA